MTRSRWLTTLLILSLAVGLPLLFDALRGKRGQSCAFDGRPVEPGSRVRVRMGEASDQEFCSIRCAELWLARASGSPTAVHVTDETTGREIDAARAFYVRVSVSSRSEVHAFADRALAEKHADLLRGRLLDGDEIPFATPRQRH